MLIGPGGLSAMAWNGALALGICSSPSPPRPGVGHPSGPRPTLLVVAGVLAGAALLYRPDMVIAMTLGLGVVWDLPAARRRPVVLAAASTLLLYVPHLLISGIGNSITGMVIEPVFDLRGGRSLPVPPSWNHVDGFLQRRHAAHRRLAAADAGDPAPDHPVVLARAALDPRQRVRRVAVAPAGEGQRPGGGAVAGRAVRRRAAPRPCNGPTRPTSPGSRASPSP